MFKWTLSYKTYDLIRNAIYHHKIKKAVKEVFYGDDFTMVVKKYLNVDLDKDWLGRLYGVINPNIDIDGNFNVSNVIIEIDGDRTNNNEYVRTWIYRQLNLMGQLFNMRNLYHNITMELEHVGPEYADNYLLIFDIASRPVLARSFRRWFYHLLGYGITAATICAMFAYNIINL